MDHCALNVAIYGPGRRRWVFSEFDRRGVARRPEGLRLGASEIGWEGDRLHVRFDEREATLGRRIRGAVTLTPSAIFDEAIAIDSRGRHRWWPVAPHARVVAEIESPTPLRFAGLGYHDANFGDEPLEAAFHAWNWSRVSGPDEAIVLYDGRRRDQSALRLGRVFAADGSTRAIEAPQEVDLGRTRWRIGRSTRADAGGGAELLRTLEDTPFYARSEIAVEIAGGRHVGVHEALDLDRFASPAIQHLLTYKTRRVRGS